MNLLCFLLHNVVNRFLWLVWIIFFILKQFQFQTHLIQVLDIVEMTENEFDTTLFLLITNQNIVSYLK